MAITDSHDDTNKVNSDYTLIIIAGGLSAVFLSIILFVFASNVESRELYHGYYLLVSSILAGGFGVALAFKRFGLAAVTFALLTIVLMVSVLKFNARAQINDTILNASVPTIIGTYVPNIPIWEKRVIPYFNTPKWVEFDRDCFRPAFIEGAQIAQECNSKESIFSTYNLSVMALINGYYNKLFNTATRVRNQEFPDRFAYEGCVNDGYCAQVALLPSNVLPNSITETSPDYKEIRQAFWQLIDNEVMSVEYCDTMDLCRVMTQAGAIDRRDFQANL